MHRRLGMAHHRQPAEQARQQDVNAAVLFIQPDEHRQGQ